MAAIEAAWARPQEEWARRRLLVVRLIAQHELTVAEIITSPRKKPDDGVCDSVAVASVSTFAAPLPHETPAAPARPRAEASETSPALG